MFIQVLPVEMLCDMREWHYSMGKLEDHSHDGEADAPMLHGRLPNRTDGRNEHYES